VTAIGGQASAEYAGLLGLAALLGAMLALVAAPPLLGAVRDALAAALARSASVPAPVSVSAADVADVESALLPSEDAQTPDAALVRLRRRHGIAQAAEVAEQLLFGAARATTPWVGAGRRYRAWMHRDDGPYKSVEGTTGDLDVERPTGPPVVQWITIAAQHRAVAGALAHHANPVGIALDVLALIPTAGVTGVLRRIGARPFEQLAVTRAREAIDDARITADAIELFESDDGDLPPGMRAGDVVVAWPVHRTAWRDGLIDPAPRIDSNGFGSVRLVQDYVHLVFLRPKAGGLAVIAQGFGT
jgi:hypothetical protein